MPMAPISMRKLKEILRLKYGCMLSHRKIAKSLSVSAQRQSCLFMPFVQLPLGSLAGRWMKNGVMRRCNEHSSKPNLRARVISSLIGLLFSRS